MFVILSIGGVLQLLAIGAAGYEVRTVYRKLRDVVAAIPLLLRERLPSLRSEGKEISREIDDRVGIGDTTEADDTLAGSGVHIPPSVERRLHALELAAEKAATGDDLRTALAAVKAGRTPVRLFILVAAFFGVVYATWAQPIADGLYSLAIGLALIPAAVGVYAIVDSRRRRDVDTASVTDGSRSSASQAGRT